MKRTVHPTLNSSFTIAILLVSHLLGNPSAIAQGPAQATLADQPFAPSLSTSHQLSFYIDCRTDTARDEECHAFSRPSNRVAYPGSPAQRDFLVQAINGSKIMYSGTVLEIHTHIDCSNYDWNVVTQGAESSSVVIYGPGDIGAGNCVKPDNSPTHDYLLYVTIPVHVLWAEVTGYQYQPQSFIRNSDGLKYGGDSFHNRPKELKPTDPNATKGDCQGTPADIHLCDRYTWPMSWFYPFGGAYTRLTQPGTGQGTISFSPVIGTSETLTLSYDVQIYASSKLGIGWIGIPLTFEKNSNQKANLDSLTTALSYEFHFGDSGDLFPRHYPDEDRSKYADATPRTIAMFTRMHCDYNPCVTKYQNWPVLRTPALQVRSGIEYAPTTPHDFNAVQSAVLKQPIVLNLRRQPSAFTAYPIAGMEAVQHLETHPILAAAPETASQTRYLVGADASLRWPFVLTHNFLGDKPITIEYSYRDRWLSNPEPATNFANGAPFTETLSTGHKVYQRMSYNAPISSYLQFKVTAQHGSLPPDFHALGWSLQIGLSFSDPGSVEH